MHYHSYTSTRHTLSCCITRVPNPHAKSGGPYRLNGSTDQRRTRVSVRVRVEGSACRAPRCLWDGSWWWRMW
jgi:hypothetical protein